MADERRQLILDLLARAKTKQGTDEAADDLDKLATAAEEADKKTEQLGTTSEKTGHQTDKMGNSLSETKGRIANLDRDIENVTKELNGMSAAFADASDTAERKDISKAIRRTQNELRELQKNKTRLSDLLPDPTPDSKWTDSFKKNFGALFKSVGDLAGPALGIGIVAAAPAIGATLAGAIVGGAGLTGIAGGIFLATKDPKVQSGLEALKKHIGDQLKDAAQPFVPVTIGAIGQVKRAFDDIDFRSAFKDAAAQAGPLIDGLTDTVTKLGGAFVDLIHNSGPEIKAIGQGLSQVSDALAAGLHSLADDGKAGSDALTNLFTVISVGITTVFGLVDALAKVYDVGRRISGGGLVDAFRAYDDAMAPISGKARDIAESTVGAITGTKDLAKAQDDAARAAIGQRDALEAVSKELRAQTDPAFAVLDATDKVRNAHEEAAKATKKYGANSEEARAATRKLAEAAIDLQGDVGALGGSFDGRLTPTMKRTLSAAGLTKGEIKQVERELRRAKTAADAYAGRYVAEIITNYTYNVGGNDYNREANRGSFSKRAAGGPIVRGTPYIVGENGPEIVIPSDSGRVLSAGASRGLMVQGAMTGLSGGYGGGVPRELRLTVDGNDQRLVSLLKYLIRTANLIEA